MAASQRRLLGTRPAHYPDSRSLGLLLDGEAMDEKALDRFLAGLQPHHLRFRHPVLPATRVDMIRGALVYEARRASQRS